MVNTIRYLSFFFALQLLASSAYTWEAVPVLDVEESNILLADAEPKAEPLSPYGNPLHYRVDNKVYHVLRTARGFEQRGVASWYGTKFHKKRTSSGEPYDMYAMTAAHKTLPLPTYIRVTNLENGRELIVRVNDRGPFHSDRILDLSYAAAQKLGMTKQGIARVRIVAIVPEGDKEKHDAHFYIQVAAYKAPDYANRLRDKLQKFLRHPVVVGKKSQFYVVFVGPLKNKSIILSTKDMLARYGFKQTLTMLR